MSLFFKMLRVNKESAKQAANGSELTLTAEDGTVFVLNVATKVLR